MSTLQDLSRKILSKLVPVDAHQRQPSQRPPNHMKPTIDADLRQDLSALLAKVASDPLAPDTLPDAKSLISGLLQIV